MARDRTATVARPGHETDRQCYHPEPWYEYLAGMWMFLGWIPGVVGIATDGVWGPPVLGLWLYSYLMLLGLCYTDQLFPPTCRLCGYTSPQVCAGCALGGRHANCRG